MSIAYQSWNLCNTSTAQACRKGSFDLCEKLKNESIIYDNGSRWEAGEATCSKNKAIQKRPSQSPTTLFLSALTSK